LVIAKLLPSNQKRSILVGQSHLNTAGMTSHPQSGGTGP